MMDQNKTAGESDMGRQDLSDFESRIRVIGHRPEDAQPIRGLASKNWQDPGCLGEERGFFDIIHTRIIAREPDPDKAKQQKKGAEAPFLRGLTQIMSSSSSSRSSR